MKKYVLGIVVVVTSGFSLATHAGIFDKIAGQTLAQVQNNLADRHSATAQLAALKAQNNMAQDHSPLKVQDLKIADCTDLSVYTANAKRAMNTLLTQADQYDAQQDQQAAVQKKGGFLTGALSVASFAGKMAGLAMGDTSMMEMSSQLRQVSNTLTAVNQARNQMAAQNFAASNMAATEMQADDILKRYRKHEADLENIRVYQTSKGCH